MKNPKDSGLSTYYSRVHLPSFLTENRFNELEVELQDFIVNSSRIQAYLQKEIDVNDIDSILDHVKNQNELFLIGMEEIDSSGKDVKDFSPIMSGLSKGIFNADMIMYMRMCYNEKYMTLREPNYNYKK